MALRKLHVTSKIVKPQELLRVVLDRKGDSQKEEKESEGAQQPH